MENFTLSVVRIGKNYFIQCNETGQIIGGGVRQRSAIEQARKKLAKVKSLLKPFSELSFFELKERMRLFQNRLLPKICKWSLEEAQAISKLYGTRGEFYAQNRKLYMMAYQKGWLNQICGHMKPSRKKNKFVTSQLNPNAALAKLFTARSHNEFVRKSGAYSALTRYGVDTVELFDNRDDATYIKEVIIKLAEEHIERLVGAVS
jgi:hypothetical protein